MTVAELRMAVDALVDVPGEAQVVVVDRYSESEVIELKAELQTKVCDLLHQHEVFTVQIIIDGRLQ